eukprot:8587655-Pyramimonas_sp.AAC.1
MSAARSIHSSLKGSAAAMIFIKSLMDGWVFGSPRLLFLNSWAAISTFILAWVKDGWNLILIEG